MLADLRYEHANTTPDIPRFSGSHPPVRRRNRARSLILLGVGSVAAAVGLLLIAKLSTGLSKSCTLPELVEYLHDHQIGSNVWYMPSDQSSKKPVAVIDRSLDGSNSLKTIMIEEFEEEAQARQVARMTIKTYSELSDNQHGSARRGKGQIAYDDVFFAWGRFVFTVFDKPTADRIKSLLR